MVSLDWYNKNGAINVKIDGPILEEKSSFRRPMLTFSAKLDWASYICKSASKKIVALIHSI